jgi:glycosyltransferase involved in cell wall biosynthesis
MDASSLKPPMFSVIVPCFNDGRWAVNAIRSCLNQVCDGGLEVLLVDDGSKDGSAELIEESFRGDQQVRVLRKGNGGLASARNHGLKHARGQWILYLDSDDEMGKECFTDLQRVLKTGTTSVPFELVVLPFKYVVSDGSRRDSRLLINAFLVSPRFTNYQTWNRFWVRVGNTLPVSAFVVSASFAKRVGVFDESLKAHEDWDYWIRMIDHGARVQYTHGGPKGATLITLRDGMSADKKLMSSTRCLVRCRHCTHGIYVVLTRPWVIPPLLVVRTILGLLESGLGQRLNFTRWLYV